MKMNVKMNRVAIVIVCILMFCNCGQKRATIIDSTVHDDQNTSTIEIVVDTVLINHANGASVVVYKQPLGPQEMMFDAILEKYRDKVVVVDFWATWCGPCMQAMKSIKPLKEEMKENDVVWLYLTGETSPLKTWIKTYPDISGEHFRVSKKQFDYWGTAFNIKGIPTYMVYDKQGQQLSKYTGFPGVASIKKDIQKLL